jgi:hypothetical protein
MLRECIRFTATEMWRQQNRMQARGEKYQLLKATMGTATYMSRTYRVHTGFKTKYTGMVILCPV